MLPTYKLIELCHQLNRSFVLVGGPEDIIRGDEIVSNTAYGLNACGHLSLTQSTLLVKGAEFVVSHDTGMMHISAAFKKGLFRLGQYRASFWHGAIHSWCFVGNGRK